MGHHWRVFTQMLKAMPRIMSWIVSFQKDRTSKWDLIWMWGLCIGNQAKTNWFRWVLIQPDWLSYEKGKMSTQRQMHTNSTPCATEGRDWGDASTSQGLLASHYFFLRISSLLRLYRLKRKSFRICNIFLKEKLY